MLSSKYRKVLSITKTTENDGCQNYSLIHRAIKCMSKEIIEMWPGRKVNVNDQTIKYLLAAIYHVTNKRARNELLHIGLLLYCNSTHL